MTSRKSDAHHPPTSPQNPEDKTLADIDAKVARLGRRVADRTDGVRAQLDAMGALELAEVCREVFQAKLAYLGPDSDLPHGQPYNFELKPFKPKVRK